MLPSRATSIRSYRILNKTLYALSLTPGALEWTSKRKEVRKWFPPQDCVTEEISSILKTLDAEMDPAIIQLSREILTAEADDVGDAEGASAPASTRYSSNIALKAVQKAIHRLYSLPHSTILQDTVFMKEIIKSMNSSSEDKQKELLKLLQQFQQRGGGDTPSSSSSASSPSSPTSSFSRSSSPSSSESLLVFLLLQQQIGMYRQKTIFDSLRVLNSNVWFYSDRFWWRCFPIGAGVMMDKSTRWQQTPRELGDYITEALRQHYVSAKKEQERRYAQEGRQVPAMYQGYQSLPKSSVTANAEKVAGASDPLLASPWRSSATSSSPFSSSSSSSISSSAPSAQQHLARSALFRMSFSAAGIHSRVADFVPVPSSASSSSCTSAETVGTNPLFHHRRSNTFSSTTAATEVGPDELQQEKLIRHFPKLQEQLSNEQKIINNNNNNNINSNNGNNNSSNNKQVTRFDASQAVIAELYLRARRALSFHVFFDEFTFDIARFSPYEDWRFFLALLDANARSSVDEKVRELLKSLPEPSEIRTISELKAVTSRAHREIFRLLSLNSSSAPPSGDESLIDGDDPANPLDKLFFKKNKNQHEQRSEVEVEVEVDDGNGDITFATTTRTTRTTTTTTTSAHSDADEGAEGTSGCYKQENDNPSVEKILSELPAEVLVRMVAHILECCLQYANEGLVPRLVEQKHHQQDEDEQQHQGGHDSMTNSSSSLFHHFQSESLTRTLLPIFDQTPGTTGNQLPRLQHRLSLHGTTFLIAAVMARFGIPWRTMKGSVPLSNLSQHLGASGIDASALADDGEYKKSTTANSSSNGKRRRQPPPQVIEEFPKDYHDDPCDAGDDPIEGVLVEEAVQPQPAEAAEEADVTLLPPRRSYKRLTREELDEIREIQADLERGEHGEREVVDFKSGTSNSSSTASEASSSSAPLDKVDDKNVNNTNNKNNQSSDNKFKRFLEQKQREQDANKSDKRSQLELDISAATDDFLASLHHFATVDIETEMAAQRHHLELQLSGTTLVHIPKVGSVESEAQGNPEKKKKLKIFSKRNFCENKEDDVDEDEIRASKMLAEKRLVDESTGTINDESKEQSQQQPRRRRRPIQEEAVLTQNRLFPVFIEVYRTSNDSPIVSGSIIAPKPLASHVHRALILRYTNVGAIGGGSGEILLAPWSKGPRQDPILGLTSQICHAHLTKCEILAFDEDQGEDEKNRHMTLLRDATALWTTVLQLF